MKQSTELLARGESFALAVVVRCQPPTSGKPGDKAIIHADGRLAGWIGGGCAQPVVIREALRALADGKPRLVRISPSTEGAEEGVVDYTMSCHSGGALDIYIEPVQPAPPIVLLGSSPVARTLARLGRAAGYSVSAVVLDAAGDFTGAEVVEARDYNLDRLNITARTFIVVSTQGEGDEEALERAARSDAGYVAFVASRTKAGKVLDFLREKGVAAQKLDRIKAPAGLDLGAATPEEIAVSILAEIVQVGRARLSAPAREPAGPPVPIVVMPPPGEAKDPVCGMTVDSQKARYKSEYRGRWVYFCCAGCKQKFDRQPSDYVVPAQV